MDASELDTRFRNIFIIWLALAVGVFFFVVTVWLVTSGVLPGAAWEPVQGVDEGVLRMVVALPTLMLLAGILLRRGEVAKPGMDGPALVAAYQIRVILAAAIQEAGGLIMGALALLSGLWTWALGFGALTLFAMVLSRPRRDELDALVRGR